MPLVHGSGRLEAYVYIRTWAAAARWRRAMYIYTTLEQSHKSATLSVHCAVPSRGLH